MELIRQIGTILGYIATGIGLLAIVRTSILARTKKYVEETAGTEKSDEVHHELDSRLTTLEQQFQTFLERDTEFKNIMDSHISTQQLVDRKLMANIIEQLYYQNREKKTLDDNEFRRLTEVYEIYHSSPVNGNSYISELYQTMLKWERIP